MNVVRTAARTPTALLVLTLAAVTSFAPAQDRRARPAPPPTSPRQQTQPLPPQQPPKQPEQEAPAPVFSLRVTNVLAPVTVTDGKGDYIVDLKPEDFQLLDNGERQQINVELAEMPLSLVILIGISAKLEPMLPQMRRVGSLFTNLVMGESGEAAVITYDHRVEVAQDFTNNAERIEKVFKGLLLGSEQSRMTDAVVRALSMLNSRAVGRRRVIFIVGEGRDSGSETDLGFVLSEAQRGNISIYSVGLSGVKSSFLRKPPNPGPSPFPPGAATSRPGFPAGIESSTARTQSGDIGAVLVMAVKGVKGIFFDNPLEAYSEGTGAAHLGGSSSKAMEEAVSRIGRELRSQYLVSYRPNNLHAPAFHTIRVKVDRQGVHVRTRPGYYDPGDGTSPPPANGR